MRCTPRGNKGGAGFRLPGGCLLKAPLLSLAMAAAVPADAAKAAELMSLSLEDLMALTIVGSAKYEQRQSEVAAAVSVITRAEIKAHGWRTLAEVLASLPGVYTSQDRRYTYQGVRGFGMPGDTVSRLLVTINGNRVNDPVYDAGITGREFPLDLDLVERIEFIPGPGGAVYGQNAMFGVVNVVTRTGGSMDGTELALARQQPQRLRELRVSRGLRLDNGVDVLLSASHLRARGEDRLIDYGAAGVSGVAAGQDGEKGGQIFVRARGSAWSAEVVHGSRRKDDPTGSFFSDPLVPGQYATDTVTLAQLQYEGSFAADALKLSGRLFAGRYRYEQTFFYDSFPSTSAAQGDWRGTELRLLYTGVADHKLMLGVEAQDNVRTDQAQLYPDDPVENVLIPGAGHRLGVYLQDEWRLGPTLSTTLGLRVDRNSATGTRSSPRAAMIWQATPETVVKALYGRAHRAPDVYERDYADSAWMSNPALRGESIDTLELVADRRMGSDLALRAALYQWAIRNLIVLGAEASSGLPQFQAGPMVKAHGLELSADKTWAPGARLRGGVTVQDVAFARGGRLPNSPKLLARLNFSAPLPWGGLRAGFEWRYDSARLSPDGTRLGGYALSNLQLSTTALAKGMELSLHMANVFDKRHAHPMPDSSWQNALEQDGRTVRLTVRHRF